jgi:hypothetical protein
MNTDSDRANVRPTAVAFANCFDATTFGKTVYLTAWEERRLRGLLAALHDCGFLLPATFEPALPDYGFGEVVEDLRAALGGPFVDAALAASDVPAQGSEPAPVALMPVWAFEPEVAGDDVLLSSATLWGANLLVEALRVEDFDDPTPVPSVRERFDRWAAGAGAERALAPVRLPGRNGCYVVFAASAPL